MGTQIIGMGQSLPPAVRARLLKSERQVSALEAQIRDLRAEKAAMNKKLFEHEMREAFDPGPRESPRFDELQAEILLYLQDRFGDADIGTQDILTDAERHMLERLKHLIVSGAVARADRSAAELCHHRRRSVLARTGRLPVAGQSAGNSGKTRQKAEIITQHQFT